VILSFPNLVLPTCVGWNYIPRSKYSTITQTPQTGTPPASATLQQSVIYELELTYEFLKNQGRTYADDLAYLQGFYEACKGGYGWFTFDPSVLQLQSMSVVEDTTQLRNGYFGVGDGATKTFPLWRSTAVFGAGKVQQLELIQNVTLLAGIYQNGALVPAANYTLSNFPAQVTFANAPAAGQVLSWAGNFSYLCKFSEDTLEPEEFMYQLWELRSLKLDTIVING
jgi:hypothetical protein